MVTNEEHSYATSQQLALKKVFLDPEFDADKFGLTTSADFYKLEDF